MITEFLAFLTNYSLNLIEKFGYLGLVIISFLENVFTPIPSEAVIPFAGVLVSQGRMDAVSVWAAVMLGGLLGSLVFYSLGYWLGMSRVHSFVQKWGKWLFLKIEDVQKSEQWFQRYGAVSVLIGRLIPQIRSFISIPAGITKMPLGQFLFLTAVGSGLWNVFLEWLGIYFGANYTVFLPIFRKLDAILVIVAFVIVLYFIFTRSRFSSEKSHEIQKNARKENV